jgi:hypothetical protein
MRYFCWTCHKSVSSELPEDSVIRGLIVCPECIEIGTVSFTGDTDMNARDKDMNRDTKGLKRYQIKLIRREDGKWQVTGYWEIGKKWENDVLDLDGAPLVFDTRVEACSHIANMTGLPE